MGIAHSLFYSPNTDQPTLHRRTTPNQEQVDLLRARWHDLAEFLTSYIADVTGRPVKTWIQGSYKWATLIRPVRKGGEFDVDLGLYILWPRRDDQFAPADLKVFVQEALFSYAGTNEQEVTGVEDPPKERCGRIHYRESFHVDVPVYHLGEAQDFRRLATQTKGWETTDPKAIWVWFKAQLADRDILRRVIRYLKTWAALTFNDGARPSSMMLTVLATQAYQQLGDATGNGDDEVLANVVNVIRNRLAQDRSVPNPVNPAEDLNRLLPDQFAAILRQLETFADRAMQAAAAQNQLTAAMLWSDIFAFVFPMPDDEDVAPAGANLPATVIVPEIRITATVRKTGQHVATYRNDVPPIPKECSLTFEIMNPQQIPPDATIEWTVRNDGRDAENANDLGHIKPGGRRELTVVERTLYQGRHYMDCVIRRWGQVIGRRRVKVHIQRHVYPVRNRPKPAYVASSISRGSHGPARALLPP